MFWNNKQKLQNLHDEDNMYQCHGADGDVDYYVDTETAGRIIQNVPGKWTTRTFENKSVVQVYEFTGNYSMRIRTASNYYTLCQKKGGYLVKF